jgi:hypothetical protein
VRAHAGASLTGDDLLRGGRRSKAGRRRLEAAEFANSAECIALLKQQKKDFRLFWQK